MKKVLRRLILPLLIVAVGAVSARFIMARGKQMAHSAPPAASLPVEVVSVASADTAAVIATTGVVTPALDVTIVPEVSGRVVWRSPALMPGGRFAKGETLARIDARDYELAIKQAASQVRRADLELQLELGRQGIAKREWELLGGAGSEEQAALALRKPHLAAAQHSLEAAQSVLEAAQLKLDRTALVAPFNASVAHEQVEVGQVVGPASQIARLIGTDRFWVTVSVPVEALALLDVPFSGADAPEGSQAVVTQVLSEGQRIVRRGRVLRLVAQLDPQSRRAQLIVGVDNPLASEASDEGALPLLPGAFVDVELKGRAMPVYALPRQAVREGTQVWVVGEDELLQQRAVSVRWGVQEQVYVSAGLAEGDRVVTSPLALPLPGMRVSVVQSLTVGSAR